MSHYLPTHSASRTVNESTFSTRKALSRLEVEWLVIRTSLWHRKVLSCSVINSLFLLLTLFHLLPSHSFPLLLPRLYTDCSKLQAPCRHSIYQSALVQVRHSNTLAKTPRCRNVNRAISTMRVVTVVQTRRTEMKKMMTTLQRRRQRLCGRAGWSTPEEHTNNGPTLTKESTQELWDRILLQIMAINRLLKLSVHQIYRTQHTHQVPI
jgi:hypothetical protein